MSKIEIIRNKYAVHISKIDDLEKDIENQLLRHRENLRNENFTTKQKEIELMDKDVDILLKESEDLKQNMLNLGKQNQLFTANFEKVQDDLQWIINTRLKYQEQFENLEYIVKKENNILYEMKNNRLDISSKACLDHLEMYKDISQISFKKIENESSIQITINNINSRKAYLEVNAKVIDNKLEIYKHHPKEIQIEDCLEYIDQTNFDLTVFLVYFVNKGIEYYNK